MSKLATLRSISGVPVFGLYPFVCHNDPFINYFSSYVHPFVVKKIPLVRHMRIYSGFTLIELMITLAVAAILSFLAVPSMSSFVKNQRITTQTNELIADINFARSEALKRERRVVVCAATAALTCAPMGATDFTAGRLIFADANNDNAFNAADNDDLLRQREQLDGSVNILTGIGATSPIVFVARGFVTQGSGNYKFCDDRGVNFGRQVFLGAQGQTRVLKYGDANYTIGCT